MLRYHLRSNRGGGRKAAYVHHHLKKTSCDIKTGPLFATHLLLSVKELRKLLEEEVSAGATLRQVSILLQKTIARATGCLRSTSTSVFACARQQPKLAIHSRQCAVLP